MKIVIVIALLAVVAALAGAGVFMLRRPKAGEETPGQADKRMARALAVRVGLSVALFLFVLVSWKLGWISPHGVLTGA